MTSPLPAVVVVVIVVIIIIIIIVVVVVVVVDDDDCHHHPTDPVVCFGWFPHHWYSVIPAGSLTDRTAHRRMSFPRRDECVVARRRRHSYCHSY